VLILVFTPRESADIPRRVGPVGGVRIEGNTMRDADSGAVIAECEDRHWVFDGQKFYRADCAGPVTLRLERSEASSEHVGPFNHFSLSDGTAYVDRAVFAQLNSSNKWYVARLDTQCATLLLQPRKA
jgi:hypothetical protein